MMRNPEVFARAWEYLKRERPRYSIPDHPPESHRVCLTFDVPRNDFGVPSSVRVELTWDESFPYGQVNAYSKTLELSGFWHQMVGDGKLCLDRSIAEIADETLLLKTVQGVEDWLDAMTNNCLAKVGDVYELPDFAYAGNSVNDYAYSRLVYIEDEERYKKFGECRSGFCKLVACTSPRVLVPSEFTKGDVAGERIPDVACPGLARHDGCFPATWIRLPKITISNNRPPRTWKELFELAESCGFDDLGRLLRKAWESAKGNEVYFMVGWPIPRRIGQHVVMMAWRALVFHSMHYIRHEAKNEGYARRRKRKAGDLWLLSEPGGGADLSINWLEGENISYRDMTARWKLDEALVGKKVALIGCGAIGSALAELLVRGGLRQLTLIDGDRLEFGNLCRHTLSSISVGNYKAKALASQLSMECPLAEIKELSGSVNGTEDFAWNQYDLIIDCTANEKLMFPLSVAIHKSHVRCIKLFIDGRANYLTVASSGRYTRCDAVLGRLYEKLGEMSDAPHCQSDISGYFDSATSVSVMAPGCWHPTYPGRWNNIVSLVGAAMPLIERLVEGPFAIDGHATVYRFAEGESGLPEVRVVFNEDIT